MRVTLGLAWRKETLSGDHSHLGTGHVRVTCPLSGAGLGQDPESELLSSHFFGSPRLGPLMPPVADTGANTLTGS